MLQRLASRLRRLEERSTRAGGGGCDNCKGAAGRELVVVNGDNSRFSMTPCLRPGPECPRIVVEEVVVMRLGKGLSMDDI
jgi:hypothetical protein